MIYTEMILRLLRHDMLHLSAIAILPGTFHDIQAMKKLYRKYIANKMEWGHRRETPKPVLDQK